MNKKEIKNFLDISDDDLQTLYDGDTIYGVRVSQRELQSQAHGFRTERIVFKKKGAFYKFLAISYFDQVTFTKPFQVFKSEEQVTRTHYSNWIDDPDEDDE